MTFYLERPTRNTAAVPPSSRTGSSVGLALLALAVLTVGSMNGSGIFVLPSQMARSASSGPLLISGVVSGVGMLTLAFVSPVAGATQAASRRRRRRPARTRGASEAALSGLDRADQRTPVVVGVVAGYRAAIALEARGAAWAGSGEGT
jgi:hypothetical protein